MNRRSLCAKFVLIALLACAASALRAQDGLEGALAGTSAAQPLSMRPVSAFGQTLAAADFDNDQKPDGAVLLASDPLRSQTSFRIELHLSASNNAELAFESAETNLSVTASDINRDGATDVIVEQSLTHRRLYVWLNDGHGGFRKGRIEDFPSIAIKTVHEVTAPNSRFDHPLLFLPPPRRFAAAILKSGYVSGPPPSTEDFRISLAVPWRKTPISTHPSSRAPPGSKLLFS